MCSNLHIKLVQLTGTLMWKWSCCHCMDLALAQRPLEDFGQSRRRMQEEPLTSVLCTMPGCPDSDELVTFEDLLEGKSGPVEQQAALQFQRLRDAGQASQHVEPPGRVFADETGADLRIGANCGMLMLLVSLT